jgi:DNA-binding response OmpR family regulator
MFNGRSYFNYLGEIAMREVTVRSTAPIFIVEADPAIGEFLLEALFLKRCYYALLFNRESQILKAVQFIKPRLFILDYSPQVDGLALYDQLHASRELGDIPAIILSTYMHRLEDEINSRKLVGLSKPFGLDEFLMVVERAIAAPVEQKLLSHAGTA